jgi:hypothetical protein
MTTPTLILTRLLDHYNTEWLVVSEKYAGMDREIVRFKWTEDLKHWVDRPSVRECIERGDPNPLLEYKRHLKTCS